MVSSLVTVNRGCAVSVHPLGSEVPRPTNMRFYDTLKSRTVLDPNTAGFTTRAKIVCAILLLLIVGGVSAAKPANATIPPLALDGVGTNTTCKAPNCEAQLLTTTQGYDVVLLIAECGWTYCPITISSIIDSSGLTFTQRVSYAPNDKLWEFYARAVSPLRSDNITVAFSCLSDCLNQVFSIHQIQVLAIHGANTRATFDPNPSVPHAVTCPTATAGYDSCSVITETSTLDFVIALTAINDNVRCGVGTSDQVPGFSRIVWGDLELDYAITTAPQEKVVFTCLDDVADPSSTSPMAIVIDAISFRGAFGISP
ncbi:hypothetical protein E6H27_02790 [Candidatus Bathyarchaeota archaeon]|nr:MAG: hypothetical protein E6H27_02790 [Candidatus Bathyarchaeota archaeon]TMI59749.1 MAG: hypothetical protein E6H14_02500 [Candidatus Bathyarchaeota archaeon]